MEPSMLLIGEVAALVTLALVGTILLVRRDLPDPLRRRRKAPRPEAGVAAGIFCPRMKTTAQVRLAATGYRGPPVEPELTVVDCEYLSRTGLDCDFACLDMEAARA